MTPISSPRRLASGKRRIAFFTLSLVLLAATVILPFAYLPAYARSDSPAAPAAEATDYTPRFAYYYKPVENMTVAELAHEYSFFIIAKGNEDFRDQLLAAGGRRPMLVHLRAEAINDPGSCTALPWQNNVAFKPGDFCNISKNHPGWFLLDKNGKRIMDTFNGAEFYLMDPANTEWQQFYIERSREVLADTNWDGVFMDNLEVTLSFRQQQNEVPKKYQTDDAYWKAHEAFLKAIYEGYFHPNGKQLFANIASKKDDLLFPSYLTYLDGGMFEGWSVDLPDRWRSVERWTKHITVAQQVQDMGKFIILTAQGQQDDYELQKFAYASYLLVNNGMSAFRYGHNAIYREAWVYDNYHIVLGAPKGKAYEKNGVWQRDYEYGYVKVDPEAHTAEIKQTTKPPTTTVTPSPTTPAPTTPAPTTPAPTTPAPTTPAPTTTATVTVTPTGTVEPSPTPTPPDPQDIKSQIYFPVMQKP